MTAEFHHAEEVRKQLKGAEFNRYAEVRNSSPVDLLLERTTAYVRDFPNSAAAPDLLGIAIESLRAAERTSEADALSKRLVREYPRSFRVTHWNGTLPLPASPGR
jgi:hypothetical protein